MISQIKYTEQLRLTILVGIGFSSMTPFYSFVLVYRFLSNPLPLNASLQAAGSHHVLYPPDVCLQG